MNQYSEPLRVANPIEPQHATNAEFSATETATKSATINLKALALAVHERNRAATSAQQGGSNKRNNTLPEDPVLLRSVAVVSEVQPDAFSWPLFLTLCNASNATEEEVLAMFSDRDISDLCEESAQKLPLFVRTITNSIKRERPVKKHGNKNAYALNTLQAKRCKECQHFNRIEHPHLGTCIVGEPEGIAGNWDTDPRNHCKSWKSC